MFLKKTYEPALNKNLLGKADDVEKSRENFIKTKPSNLLFLLEKRYLWMNNWIKKNDLGIEVGCGNGLSKLFIKNNRFLLTDFSDFSWVELKVNAIDMPFEDDSQDFIISSNMTHHLSKPILFFKESLRVLKPGGVLIIQDVYGSFFLRLILRILRHEGYNYDIDPFNENCICVDLYNLWKGNNVIPNLLFKDTERLENIFSFKCRHLKYTEFASFLISGGVTAKAPTLNMPRFILNIIYLVDRLLIKISKDMFALQIQIVLEKK